MNGTLYIVGTPIGNPGDLSPRAAAVLAVVDFVACEERREAARLLHALGLRKPLIEVNEHTEREAADEVLAELLSGRSGALISDCGMPVFADPGTQLLRRALQAELRIEVVPGPTSLTTALAVSGIEAKRFYFHGFPSQKREERARELRALRSMGCPVVLMDTPYRLRPLLEDALAAFGGERRCCLACDLTTPGETVYRGTLSRVLAAVRAEGTKREFVLVVGGDSGARRPKPPRNNKNGPGT